MMKLIGVRLLVAAAMVGMSAAVVRADDLWIGF